MNAIALIAYGALIQYSSLHPAILIWGPWRRMTNPPFIQGDELWRIQLHNHRSEWGDRVVFYNIEDAMHLGIPFQRGKFQ